MERATSLYSYFRDSCDDGNGNRFLRVYLGDSRETVPSPTEANAYYYNAPALLVVRVWQLYGAHRQHTTLCQTANLPRV